MNTAPALDSTAPVRILIADDEPGIRDSYRDILQPPSTRPASNSLAEMRARLFGGRPETLPATEHFDLTLCAGAEEAVNAVKEAVAEGAPYSIVFLDMRMPPGPDGLWAAVRIRELDRRVEIVVVTAYSDIDPEEIGRQVPPANNLFFLQKPFHAQEIRQMARALGHRRQAEDRIRQLAYYDNVTGLPNRAFFRERLNEELISARANRQPLALLFIDLDNFKRINDTLGHSVGDLLLNEVTKRLMMNLRASDLIEKIHPGQHPESLARLGGDEFTLLLSPIKQRSDAGLVAERILRVLGEPFELVGHDVIVTASIGVAAFPEDGEEAETLLRNADTAMYFAKRQGRNAFQYYQPAMNEEALKRLALEAQLRQALDRKEFVLHYQPQIDLASGNVTGMEALLRWNCTALGFISPADFIPLAEETGQIIPIGEWVMRTACVQARAWKDEGVAVPRVAVNVSVNQFAQNGFAALVGRILTETGLDPSALEIEITESLLMKEGEAAMATLRELKALGIQIAIDDFGTGYSNLAYLKQFPIDRLKIDRGFLSSVSISSQEQAIVSAIIALAENMQLCVTAEGVETENQVAFLQSRNCDEAQGFFYSRPLPPQQVDGFIKRKPS
jgi:diguanylate cyclase (GGDEF)-like protein